MKKLGSQRAARKPMNSKKIQTNPKEPESPGTPRNSYWGMNYRTVGEGRGGGAIGTQIFGNFTYFHANSTLKTFKFGSF